MIIENSAGNQFELPDGATPHDIDEVLQHYASQQSYPQRVWNDVGNSVNKGADIITQGNLNPLSAAIQAGSQATDAALSPIKEAIPDAIAQPIGMAEKYAKNAGSNIAQSTADLLDKTSVGQRMGDYLMNSPHVQNGMQEVSDDAKALANLLMVSPTGKAVEGITKIAGDPLYDAAKQTYVQDLVKPKITPTQAAKNAINSKQINGTNTYFPPADEARMAQAVSDIPAVDATKSYQANLDAIQAANDAEHARLKSLVEANDAPINIADISTNFQKVKSDLDANPALVGSTREAADKVSALASKSIVGQPLSASGMLQARKNFDAQVMAYKPQLYESEVGSAMSDAARGYRAAMNKMVADAVPSVDVLPSLQRQAALYDAAENVAPKAGAEAPTRMGRMLQKISPHNMMTTTGGALIADTLAHAGVPPSVLATALGTYGAVKAARSPVTAAVLGKALGGGQ